MSGEGDSGRSYLPWVVAGLVLVIGGAKVEAARPLVARAIAIAGPILPVAIGVKRVEGASHGLERAAGALGWITILAGELCVASGFFHVDALGPLLPLARFTLYGAGVGALVVGALDTKAGGKSRFGAYVGIAAGFSIWLSMHASKDGFGSVFGAFFVGFFAGGGAGLLLGELLGKGLKKVAP